MSAPVFLAVALLLSGLSLPDVLGAPSIPRARPSQRCANRPPAGFVNLKKRIPSLKLDIRYASANNFMGARLPGYGAARAWLLRRPAIALKKVQSYLGRKGLGLLVHDAYRPYRATLAMVAWARRVHPNKKLVGPYIARRSKHNLGIAVDLTLIRLKTGKSLNMGSAYDVTGKKAHTYGVRGKALRNRLILKRAMVRFGYKAYPLEWWHFHFPVRGARSRDVPYGCREKPERPSPR